MAHRKAETEPEELLVEEAFEPTPEERAEAPKLIIIEHGPGGDADEKLPYTELEEARDALAENGVLYLTVDKAAIPHQQVTQYLVGNFRSLGALNVGTNPKLQSNDFRNRAGWMCLK